MKIKTATLEHQALDWAVAKCEGGTDFLFDGITWGFKLNGEQKVLAKGWSPSMSYCPSTDWSQGGPIIEREGIELLCNLTSEEARRFVDVRADWRAAKRPIHREVRYYGPTPLVAAMRAFVASRLGDEPEVPDELF